MKKLTRRILLCGLLCFFVAIASAQQREITGTVRDASGNPVENASVLVKGTTKGEPTNAAGHFTISINNPKAVLVISSVNFKSKEITVGQNSALDITLEAGTGSLNEVVVTAYGIKKSNKNLGYSETTVGGDEIARTNTVNPITALQGKVAGVQVNVMSSAGVQTSPYIQIRGAKVLGGNNQPIFVIDGNVLQNNIVGGDAADGGSQLKNLNPDDYESITVLKGAAATAIYGSRGLNGAVVITTKTGKAGKGIGVEYSTTYASTNVYSPFMKLQNSYGMGFYYREGNFAPDGTQTVNDTNWGPAFDGSMHPAVYNPDTLVPYKAQPNNWKTFYQNGKYTNNNVTLSGAAGKTNYRFSYSNTSDRGILPNNALNRNAFDVKIGGEINKVFSFDMGLNYANTQTENFYNQSRYAWPGGGNLGFDVFYMPRNTDFATWHNTYRNADNSTKPDNGFGYVVSGFSILDKNHYTNTENSFLGYLQLKAQVSNWLDFSARGNINYLKNFAETKNYGNGQFNSGGQYGVNSGYSTAYNLLFMAHGFTSVMNNDLKIDARVFNEDYGSLLGENYSASTNGGLKVPNAFFLDNSLNSLFVAGQSNINYGYNNENNTFVHGPQAPSTRTIGIAGVINFNYKEFLNLELTARNDWLSTLTYPVNVPGKNNFSVFYPSANLSYSFYDNFKENMPSWLSSGKIRASLAQVGNAGVAGPYTTGSGYLPGTTTNQNGGSISSATQINGNVKPNYNLKPQIQKALELGTNLSFFKNLLNIDFTWYKTNTKNQLLHIDGVQETGYNKFYFNAGNIQNAGIELLVDVNPIKTKDWNLDFSVNLSHNTGKIISFYPGITKWNITGDYEGAQVWGYQGGAYGDLVVRGSTAFQTDPKTGYPIIQNANRSTNTNPNNKVDFANYQYAYVNSDSLVNMGKIEPNMYAGFNFNLRYKNFSLASQIDGRFGGMVYSESYTYAMGQGTPLASLKYRDQAHGGVARTDSYTGKTVYNGAVPNAVFGAGQKGNTVGNTNVDISGMTFKQAYDKGLVESWYAPAYYDGGFGYNGTYDWENGLNYNGAVAKESWIMLREITLAYQLPSSWIKKTHVFQGARLAISARNIGYLYNSLPGKQNPESVQSNDPFNPWITGGVPFARTYSATLNVRF
ncbi:MAG: SusC/RagA family TonB-linked outer membrane protein [Bacteroidota bacterium]|nr:SusC/RagA family TonB-linked outer membrane protein [Bacteroidota bacterium]